MMYLTNLLYSKSGTCRQQKYLCHMDAIFQIGQIQQIAKAYLKAYKNKKVWAFYASMGSGKTTFIHALCEALGVKTAVSSPTFAIINEYTSETARLIYHMDLYRLKDEEEAINAGVEDAIATGDLCLIEWPEKAPLLLPDDALKIHIEILDDRTRRIFTSED